ncbi:MAG: RsmB/NOP family class I SAM-dependent RNA methyltransferase [Pseudomonadota bacterium]
MGKGGTASRRAAAELLFTVIEKRRTLDDAMVEVHSYADLEGSDRAFARAMASAALRQLGRINAALQPLLDRPLETASPPVRCVLQIGAAQIWCLDTPVHAAVGETVEAAKSWPQARRASGFLNAVLRKLPAEKPRFDELPAKTIWPDWFRQTLETQFSADLVNHFADQQIAIPAVHLTAKDGDGTALAETLGTEWLTGPSATALSSDISVIPGYDAGEWWVQDAAAALPARLLRMSHGQSVVDLCAAPGGKTMQLAAAGARVFAIDRSKARLKRLEDNLKRTGLANTVELIVSKGEEWAPPEPVDAVLVDAPCSALGTLRRHPEGPWIKRPDEIAGYPAIQKKLLEAGLQMLKPGGSLVYCVCSPLHHEGREVVDSVLSSGGAAHDPVVAEEIPGFEHAVTDRGELITLPGQTFSHDAFFISRLVKNA